MNAAITAEPYWAASPAVTEARVIRSEWTKFHSLRSTRVMLAVYVVLTVGLAGMITALVSAHWGKLSHQEKATFDAALTPLQGIHLSQLAVGVLGVLLISGEYSTGMIRASLTVVPTRYPVLRAKLAVFAAAIGVLSLVASFGAFFLGQYILSGRHLDVTIASTHALRTVIFAAIYLLMVGIIGMALGALMRNTAGAISTLVGLFFVLPVLFNFLPQSWSHHVAPYLPAQAGFAFLGATDGYSIDSPALAFAVLCGWTAAVLIPAFVRLARTDA